MAIHHRLAVFLCIAGGLALAVIGIRSVSATPSAGASLTWASPASSPAPNAAAATPSSIAIAPSSPPASAAQPLGGLQAPLSAMFHQLNNETRNTAVGEFALLGDIGNAIRDRIVGFLKWVIGGR